MRTMGVESIIFHSWYRCAWVPAKIMPSREQYCYLRPKPHVAHVGLSLDFIRVDIALLRSSIFYVFLSFQFLNSDRYQISLCNLHHLITAYRLSRFWRIQNHFLFI